MLPCITETVLDGRVALHLVGDFDLQSRATLERACERLSRHEPSRRVVIDLSGVEFIDCASLRILARAVQQRRRVGDPSRLVGASPFVRRILDVGGFLLDPAPVTA